MSSPPDLQPERALALRQTPGQTLGPFFEQGLLRTHRAFQVPGLCADARDVFDHVLAREGALGERIRVEGVVYDGLGQPIADALLEAWQADAAGRYPHAPCASRPALDPAFGGFGRAATDPSGAFAFVSVRPGPVPDGDGGLQAPHLNIVLGARGMTRHAFTRVYFEGDARLEHDRALACVPQSRRRTLIASALGRRDGCALYRFDIHLQGADETVFFEL